MFWGWRNLPTMYRAFEELKKEMENLTTYTKYIIKDYIIFPL